MTRKRKASHKPATPGQIIMIGIVALLATSCTMLTIDSAEELITDRPVGSSMQPTVPTPCRNEAIALPALCNSHGQLPACSSEDDAVDGTGGQPCFWTDPDTGWLWYNDGDGQGPARLGN